MLSAKAEITFTVKDRKYVADKYPLRPAFRFDEGLLFSGNIKSEETEYLYNKKYPVDIEFFTIEEEGYSLLKPYLHAGIDLIMQEGSRIIGLAQVSDFSYQSKQ